MSALGSLRPHFKKSFEELQKDHEVAYQRFTKNYERATNRKRTSIQPRSGGEATAKRDLKRDDSTQSDTLLQAPPYHPASSRTSTIHPPHPPKTCDDEELDEFSFPLSAARNRFPVHFYPNHDPAWEENASTGTHHPNARFFASSPYAPRRLEQDSITAQRGDKWRQAFDELLVAQEGMENGRESSLWPAQLPLLSWIDEVHRRGLNNPTGFLQDIMKDEAIAEDAFNNRTEDSDAEVQRNGSESHTSELDLYEQFLGGRRLAERQSAHGPQGPNKPTITSTLTTTESRRLPDGTVITKTVLKKQFADGSEVSQEKTSTTHAPLAPHKSTEDASERPTAASSVSRSLKRDTGSWLPGFWSSS